MDRSALDELLERARRREPDALGRLVDLYAARVYGLLVRLTGDRDAAEDLLQETFLRVCRMISEYQHDGRFESWLMRIAANLARDRARLRRRRGITGSLDDAGPRGGEGESAAGPSPRPDEALAAAEAGARLEAALAQLSDPEREILVLRHYADLPFREIADLLGVPLGTALARAHRALGRLRELMRDAEA